MNKLYIVGLFLLLFQPALWSQQTVKELLEQGIRYHDAGQYPSAITSYELALKIDPESAEAMYELSLSLMENGNYHAAIEYCDKLIDRNDKFSVLAYNTKGSSLNYLGRTDEAIEVYIESLDKERAFYLTYYNLGLAYFTNEEYDEARKAFINALDLNPQHAVSHLNLGRTMLQMGKRAEGLLCLYYFLLIEPESERSLLAYDTLILQLNYSEPIEVIDPSDTFAPIDRLLSEQAATIDQVSPHKNDVEKFTQLTHQFFMAFGDRKDDPDTAHDFWWEFYIPFFKSMAQWDYTDIFCHYIRQSAYRIPEAWLSVNKERIRSFNAWLSRQ